MNRWQPVEKRPEKPGSYWTIKQQREAAEREGRGVVLVRTTDTGWQTWDGKKWSGPDQPTHYFIEAGNA